VFVRRDAYLRAEVKHFQHLLMIENRNTLIKHFGTGSRQTGIAASAAPPAVTRNGLNEVAMCVVRKNNVPLYTYQLCPICYMIGHYGLNVGFICLLVCPINMWC
jgi:hypothetical protein